MVENSRTYSPKDHSTGASYKVESEGPLKLNEVKPLLDALFDPVQEVRVGALRVLVRLPLEIQVWNEVAKFLWKDLVSEKKRILPFEELVQAAIYVPFYKMQRELYRHLRMGNDEERRMTAFALAKAKDAEAIPQLMAELDGSWRIESAKNLTLVDVSFVKDALIDEFQSQTDGDVRFWLSLALARVGEKKHLKKMLHDLATGSIEVRLFWGDPAQLTNHLALMDPFPENVRNMLQKVSEDETYQNIRGVIDDLLNTPPSDRDIQPMGADIFEETVEKLDYSKLEQKAVYVSKTYFRRFVRRNAIFPREHSTLMNHLPSKSATKLVSKMFAHVVKMKPPTPEFMGGNVIMDLPQEIWRSFVPDISSLFNCYLSTENQDVRWQLAWAMSRRGVRPVLKDLAPRLVFAKEGERKAIVELLEKVIISSRLLYGPKFGGGEVPADVLPSTKSFIEHEAALGYERMLAPPPARARAYKLKDEAKPYYRRLQAQVFELRNGFEIKHTKALRAGAKHRLRVFVGRPREGMIIAPEDFTEIEKKLQKLEPNKEVYELNIIFWEPNHVPRPISKKIYLPKLVGDSSACEFGFKTKKDVQEFEGCLVVAYGARVLRIYLLIAQVLTDPDDTDATIKLQPESPIRTNMDDLELLQPVDYAVIAKTGDNNSLKIAEIPSPKLAGSRAKLHSLENIQKFKETLFRELLNMTKGIKKIELDDKTLTKKLRKLARLGNRLYRAFAKQMEGSDLLDRKKTTQIQLISHVDSVLPLELFYDRQSPSSVHAELCDNWRKALEKGECSDCDEIVTSDNMEESKEKICPIGFWCISRVIERHAVVNYEKAGIGDADYELRKKPSDARRHLKILEKALCAAHYKVKDEEVQSLYQTLMNLTNQEPSIAKNWDDWREAINKHAPSILVLFAHTFEEDDFLNLEIGEKELLSSIPVDGITKNYVQAMDSHSPVVLLLGCETAAPEMPFEGFVPQFRDNGAALILTTLTKVRARHIVPVANLLLNELKRASEKKELFGDALLRMRRKALASGLPTALTLIAYGDAGWRLSS